MGATLFLRLSFLAYVTTQRNNWVHSVNEKCLATKRNILNLIVFAYV